MSKIANRTEFIVLIAAIVASALIAGVSTRISNIKATPPHRLTSTKVNISRDFIVDQYKDLEATPNDSYILIEFMDYECNPCRSSDAYLKKIISRKGNILKTRVCNFPLPFHKNATNAALSVESARDQGQFNKMHDAVITSENLDMINLKKIAEKLGLNMDKYNKSIATSAIDSLEKDKKIAEKLGIDETPSFFLCKPNGEVYRVGNVTEIERFLQ